MTDEKEGPIDPMKRWEALSPEEKNKQRELWGFSKSYDPTIEEVRTMFSDTKARIRRIEERALKKPRGGNSPGTA